MNLSKKNTDTKYKNSLRIFLDLAKGNKRELSKLLAFQIAAGIVPAIAVYLGSIVVDVLSGGQQVGYPFLHNIYSVIVVYALVILLGDVIESTEFIVSSNFEDKVKIEVKWLLIRKIARIGNLLTYEDSSFQSRLSVLESRLDDINDFVSQLSFFMIGFIGVLSLLFLSMSISWWIPIIILLGFCPFIYQKFKLEQDIWGTLEYMEETVKKIQIIEESIKIPKNGRSLRLLDLNRKYSENWYECNGEVYREYVKKRKKAFKRLTVWSIPLGLSVILPILYTVSKVDSGELSVGKYVIVSGVIMQIRTYLSIIISNFNGVWNGVLTAESLGEIIHHSEYIQTTDYKDVEGRKIISIEIDEFGYPGSDQIILQNIKLDIYKGDYIVVFGRNGAGKSSLVNVISGLYSTENIRRTSFINREPIFCIVGQSNERSPMSLRENIDPEGIHDESQIAEALAIFDLDHLVEYLDLPCDRRINGALELSGGQWQKIGIIRAYLAKDTSDLIILDEFTSALDPDSERRAIEIVKVISESCAVVAISHRKEVMESGTRNLEILNGSVIDKRAQVLLGKI